MVQKKINRDQVNELAGLYQHKQLSRRDFLLKCAALGISLPAMGTILAACGQSEPEVVEKIVTVEVEKEVEKVVTASPADISGKVTFCYDGWGNAWDDIFNRIKTELPKVEMEVILINGDEMADKSITMCAAGQMTWDIVVWMGRRQDHIDGGYILPVNGLVKKELIDDLTDVYKEVMTTNGLLWSLPWYQNYGFTVLYNKEMWTEAGFEAGPAITWDEFAQQLYALRDSGVNNSPLIISGRQDFDSALTFDNIVKAHGGYWFEPWTSPSEITPAFTSNEANMIASEWIEKLIKDEIVHPACMNFEAAGVNELFNGGESATLINYSYAAAKSLDPSQSKIVDVVGCVPMPGVDGEHSGGSFASGEGYYIYKQAEDRDLAAVVAAYEILAGPWANTLWSESAALGPAYESIQDDPLVLEGMPFMPEWSEQGKYSVVRETNPQWELPFAGLGIITEWKKNAETYLSAFYTGAMDAKTMWKKMEDDYLEMEERAIKDGRYHEI